MFTQQPLRPPLGRAVSVRGLELLVVGKDQASLDPWRSRACEPEVRIELLANSAGVCLASLANDFVSRCQADVVGICHADCSFPQGSLGVFAEDARLGRVSGIVGITLEREYWWSKMGAKLVSTLDSNSVFFPWKLWESGLRFDAKIFNGFHCWVEDFCIQASIKHVPISVPAAPAEHVGESTLDPQWQESYRFYRAWLDAKWRGLQFETT